MSRTDRLLADLERAFEALDEGRLDDAASILELCRRIDRKNPDVVTLGAALADAAGDTEEALAGYHELVGLRPDDPMPRICIARLELDHNGDPDAALATLADAFDFIDEEADLIEAIYVRTRALLAQDQPAAARESLAEIATSVFEDGDLALELADLALAAEDPAMATRWVEAARKLATEDDAPPDLEADALHLLGRIHEATGDAAAMVAAWKQVLELDREAPADELEITDDRLEEIVEATLAELPEEVRARLVNVPILLADLPDADIVADGFDPRLLGMFQGSPMTAGSDGPPAVTNILLFKKNLERFAEDEDHLEDEIRTTVLHETAHYFGLDEDDLVNIGLD